MQIVKNLKEFLYFSIFLSTSMITFAFSYYLMATLPGERDFSCVVGAGLNTFNVLFSLILSLATGLLLAAIFSLYQKRIAEKELGATSFSGLAVVIGLFPVFCTACTFPVLSLFGLSIGLGFFTDYNLAFKAVSLILMGMSLYMTEKQLKGACKRCAF